MRKALLSFAVVWSIPAAAAQIDVKCSNTGLTTSPVVEANFISGTQNPNHFVVNRLTFSDPNNVLGGSAVYSSLTDSNSAYAVPPMYTAAGITQGRSGVLTISDFRFKTDAVHKAHFTQAAGGTVHVLHVTCRNGVLIP